MTLKKVLVTDLIPKSTIKLLKKHFIVDINTSGKDLSREEILDTFNNYDAVLSMFSNKIDKEVIDKLSNVKIIANYAVGHNNIDVAYAKSKGIAVSNTPDVLSDTTAETAWALLISVARRIVEADKFVRKGQWEKFSFDFMAGQDIHNKTIGIVGAGRIGKRFAQKSVGYNMNILYYNRKRDIDFENEYGAEYVDINTLLANADFVSIHVPLSSGTHHLINYDNLSLMKKNAILINTSRGAVVDERALVRVLEEKKIFGAGLDVYEFEPNIPIELIHMDNVVLLPHIGSSTIETRTAMADLAARNIISVLNGGEPLTGV